MDAKPMSEISAKLVMELRDETGQKMMLCKQALVEAKGDKAAAVEWLRKQGHAAVTKMAGRETPDGGIGMALGSGKGALVLLGCQTDFVAKNDAFKALVQQLADLALATGATSVDSLNQQSIKGVKVPDVIANAIQTIGENLVITKVQALTGAVVTGYSHGGRIAALVAGSGDATQLRQIALHVVSANPVPVALSRADVDPALVAKEREIIIAANPDIANKPEAMRPKIIDGKLGRFFKENVVLEQEMPLSPEKGETVEKFAKRNNLTVTGFARLAV
jgi:elongation factor Ts